MENDNDVKSVTQVDSHKPDDNTVIKTPKLSWNDQTEDLLVRWADTSLCYKWLHEKSYRKFHRLNYLFSIPVIVLSTITGTLNFGINSFPPNIIPLIQYGLGCINIITGIITTLLNFFRYAQTSESHLNVEVGWSKLHRNITVELGMARKTRKEADSFIKMCRQEYDRLIESSPVVPKDIISEFKKKYNSIEGLIIPDSCDKLNPTSVFRNDDSITTEISQQNNFELNRSISIRNSRSPNHRLNINELKRSKHIFGNEPSPVAIKTVIDHLDNMNNDFKQKLDNMSDNVLQKIDNIQNNSELENKNPLYIK